jgi:hypothetical protein
MFPIFDSRLVSLAFSFVQSRSESGIEPLTPEGFRVQTKGPSERGFTVPRQLPARTINTGIAPLNTHTISI